MFVEFWKGLWQEVICNKWRAVASALTVIFGLVIGCVIFSQDYGEWYVSRWETACKLINGGFVAVSFRLLLQYALLYLVGAVSLLQPWSFFVMYLFVFVANIFHGSTIACLTSCFGLVGGGYVVVVAVQSLCEAICCFVIANSCRCVRTFSEAVFDAKSLICVIVCSFLAQILIIFLILRVITNVI